MKRILSLSILALLSLHFISCGDSETVNKTKDSVSIAENKPDDYKTAYINSVELIDEQYVLNKEKAKENGLSDEQISEIEEQLREMNSNINDDKEHKDAQREVFNPKTPSENDNEDKN